MFERTTVVDFAEMGVDVPVTRVDFEEVRLIIKFANAYPSEASVTVTSDNFYVDGKSLRRVVKVPAASSYADTSYVPKARFTVSDEGAVTMRYEADLGNSLKDVQMAGGFLSLEARTFSYAEGYFDDLAFDLDVDSVKFDFFDAFEPGTIKLVNPRARLVIENSVGAPVRLTADPSTVGFRDGTSALLTSPLDRGLDFLYPSLAEGNVVKRSELLFDRETSNLETMLNLLPNSINLGIRCAVNPDARKEKFFIYRDALVRARLEVDVPLALGFNKFVLRKALTLDPSSLENAESATFLLKIENGFGLAADAQVRFLDRDSVEVATLFPKPVAVLAAATVDAFGRVTAPSTSNVEIQVPKEVLRRIATSVSAEVVLTLDSPAGAGAKFTQLHYDNTIAVKLGAKVAVKPL